MLGLVGSGLAAAITRTLRSSPLPDCLAITERQASLSAPHACPWQAISVPTEAGLDVPADAGSTLRTPKDANAAPDCEISAAAATAIATMMKNMAMGWLSLRCRSARIEKAERR